MSLETQFLQRIIPQHEIICLATERSFPINGHGPQKFKNHFVDPKDPKADINQIIADFNAKQDTNIYFAVAGYSYARRQKKHVASLRSLLLDIDLWSDKLAKRAEEAKAKGRKGPQKKDYYLTKAEAIRAIAELSQLVPELPKPWIIDSGNGVHAYYELDADLTRGKWEALAAAFAKTVKVLKPKLMADPVRTQDAASVMRVPGTYNAKQPKSVRTMVVREGTQGDIAKISVALAKHSNMSVEEKLPADTSFLGPPPEWAHTEEGNKFGGTPLVNLPLRPILAGCRQMRGLASSLGDVPEPEWVLMLRVLNTVKKPEKAALALSKGHPRFSAQQTMRKLHHVRSSFEAPSAGCAELAGCVPDGCKDCAYEGRVWTPSQIPLVTLAEAETERVEQEIVEQVKATIESVAPAADVILPMPGYYKQTRTMSGEEITLLPVPNKNDPTDERGLIKAHIDVRRGSVVMLENQDSYGNLTSKPQDMRVHLDVRAQGRRFPVVIPAADLSSDRLEQATKTLRDVGVLVQAESPQEQRAVRKFLRHVVDVTALGQPLPYRPDKGWSTIHPLGRKNLTLGALRWDHKGRVEHGCTKGQHLGDNGESFIEAFCSGRPVGDVAKWQEAMEVYNAPRMELTQMLLFSGIANMLLPLVSTQKGGLLLALTGRSGVGKTTLLRFLGSFIGNPGRCMIPGSSTPNALVNMLKQAQFFMLPVDDTLKLDAGQLTLLLSAVSSGMERMRLTGGGDSAYSTQWQDPFYSSLLITSNYSMDAVIGTGGKDVAQLQTEAARSRLLEIPADVISLNSVGADRWYDAEALLEANYGHAVAAMAKYLAQHQTQIAKLANRMRVDIERKLVKNTPRDKQALARFWARYLACVGITSTILCDRLGLLPWDTKEIIKAGIQHVQGIHVITTERRMAVQEQLWAAITNDLMGRRRINYSYQKLVEQPQQPVPQWDDWSQGAVQHRRFHSQWDSEATGAMLLSNLNIAAPAATNVLGLNNSWRIILTSVKAANGDLLRIERRVEIGKEALEKLCMMADELAVTGWEELYYDLIMSGCPVKGVNPSSPSHWGRGAEQYKGRVNQTKESKGIETNAVRIVFPPLPPSVLEAD